MRGFTLIEMVVYMGIYSVLLVGILTISEEITEVGDSIQEKSYLEFEGKFLLNKISSDQNPLHDFYIQNGMLQQVQASSTLSLSSSQVTVSNLLFSSSTEITSSSTDVSFTLSGTAENGKNCSRVFQQQLYSSL